MKRIIIFSSILIFALSCSDNKNDKSIDFWHFWSEPYQRAVIDSLINNFEKEYDIVVNTTELSWSDGKMKLTSAFNSNTAPDVLELGSDWVAQFSSSGVLSTLSKNSINLDKFVEFSHTPAKWNNETYALPWIVDTRVMFVNMDLLRKCGINKPAEDFNELLEHCKKVDNLNNDVFGFGSNGSDKHRLYKKIMTFIWSNNASLLSNNKIDLVNPSINEALKFYKKISRNGIIDNQKNLDNYFAQGKIAYWISGSWLLKKIDDFNKIEDLKLIQIPNYNGNKGISFAGGEYLSVNENSKNKNNAIKLVKYLTSGENAVKFCSEIPEAGFPADKNYYNSDFYTDSRKSIFAEQLNYAYMTPVHPNWLEIESIIENAVEEILYDKKTVKQALIDAQNKIKEKNIE